MDIRPKVRNAALVGALAAIAATAWATNESLSYSTSAPEYVAVEESTVTTTETVAVAPTESIESTTVVTTTEFSDAKAIPVVESSIAQPGITVEMQRLSEDERIQAAVMEKLANSSNLSGKIGVESNDAVVRLSGYTTTAGQAWRAGRDAGSVVGVRYVENEIRPLVGRVG